MPSLRRRNLYARRGKLPNVARTSSGFTPATRPSLLMRSAGLEIKECPFANLPEPRGGRWVQGLTKAKMAECVWLTPVLVAQESSFSSGPARTTCDTRSSSGCERIKRRRTRGGACTPQASGWAPAICS